jgi:hypothetical protein
MRKAIFAAFILLGASVAAADQGKGHVGLY